MISNLGRNCYLLKKLMVSLEEKIVDWPAKPLIFIVTRRTFFPWLRERSFFSFEKKQIFALTLQGQCQSWRRDSLFSVAVFPHSQHKRYSAPRYIQPNCRAVEHIHVLRLQLFITVTLIFLKKNKLRSPGKKGKRKRPNEEFSRLEM